MSTHMTVSHRQPGDLSTQQQLARMIRVNHAGEYGATRIYAGQQAVLGRTACGPMLAHMAEQEHQHRAYFEGEIVRRRVRPTLLTPLWHVAGFALGAGTALLSKEAAMACTVAVEEVIDDHYRDQLEQLGEDEAPLRDTIAQFREEELEHRDAGLAEDAEQAVAYPLLIGAIKTGSRLAIWLSTRV